MMTLLWLHPHKESVTNIIRQHYFINVSLLHINKRQEHIASFSLLVSSAINLPTERLCVDLHACKF